ncbi:lipid-A-disaccharide synthase [Solimonas sp. K1W22B-7]|uniref:lipid-A-disaccharide synthase n=1 Tax=Solimonas sp. K1W22B-7 TaxID=2303331 RepID=UPI000E3345CE|nr:lipid-A-disaccharide synthase [Solimonas sp. K1W22B-7]AXQ28985.1 lipid-A-disaccharide synthase [Solimonas sp. K1W22B-7]
MRIALVAGELSGDILGAAIVRSLKQRYPQAQIYGVTGPRMVAAGCETIASIDVLSVMGIAEVIPALPRLFRLRADLLRRFLQDRPDVVIGIDAPDFNLGLERRLRERGLRTVHVVSPSVWAWRQGRVKGIARSVDRMLCLFPFEPQFYAGHGVPADYIGHPLADELDDSVAPAEARAGLGLPPDGPVVAILPGSRGAELKYLGEPFAAAAALLARQHPGIRFVTPVAKPKLRQGLEQVIRSHAPDVPWTLVEGRSRECMRAADVVLLASGTATLECLLLGRPMVVAYRAAPFTAWLMLKAGLLKTRYVSLPNLLSAEPSVPELLQEAATPERLAAEVSRLLADGEPRRHQLGQFHAVRTELRRDAAGRAAEAIAGLLSA